MFLGTIPNDARRIVADIASRWTSPTIAVACSGAFTIERTLWSIGKRSLRGCDIQLFTCTLGEWLAGRKLPLTVSPEYADAWAEVIPRIGTGIDQAAAMLVLSNVSPLLERQGPYYERIVEAYREDFPQLHAACVERLSKVTTRLEDFFVGDAVPYMQSLPDDVAVMSFPPFFAGGYEKQFGGLAKIFAWEPPEYEMLSVDALGKFLDPLMNRKEWFVSSPNRIEQLEPYMCGKAQTTLFGVPLWMYSSDHAHVRLANPTHVVEPCKYERLGTGDRITEPLTVKVLAAPQFASLRSQYLNPHITPASPTIPIGIFSGKKLIGCCAFNNADRTRHPKGFDVPAVYMLSDFPVAPVAYKRLSKLVVACAKSAEVQHLCQTVFSRRIRTICTTAFSNQAVSMKYRGLLTLTSRSDIEPSDPSSSFAKYKLNYACRVGEWTLAEAFDWWNANHSDLREGYDNG